MARTRSTDAHNRVLEAALELFVERGIEPTTMDALAAASGVSKATIYKHWPEGKEPLLMELMLLVVGLDGTVVEEDSGDLYTDLVRVLNDKPRHERPEDKERLMPQMVAYSATHRAFGDAWRSRVMERPRQRLGRILTDAMRDGRLPAGLDIDVCFALLLGPIMYRHIFGKNAGGDRPVQTVGVLGPSRGGREAAPEAGGELQELGNEVAEVFCRAYEIGPNALAR
jgi:AcrR family transcriptional regulator